MTLDVRNDYASKLAMVLCAASWHLYQILGSSFQHRVQEYDTEVRQECFHTTPGVLQDSIMSPVLRIVMHREMLRSKFVVSLVIIGIAN